jgi:hypothetical protein
VTLKLTIPGGIEANGEPIELAAFVRALNNGGTSTPEPAAPVAIEAPVETKRSGPTYPSRRSTRFPRSRAPRPAKRENDENSTSESHPTTDSVGALEGVGTWIHRQRPPYAHSIKKLAPIFSGVDRETLSKRASAYRSWITKRDGGSWSKDDAGTYTWSSDGPRNSSAESADS